MKPNSSRPCKLHSILRVVKHYCADDDVTSILGGFPKLEMEIKLQQDSVAANPWILVAYGVGHQKRAPERMVPTRQCACHKTSSVNQYLVEDFGEQIIGYGGFQEWPPR
ncbi:hypothetical protein AVEN_151479-1 [Araneus ventricosus]|uniref:Uncharacterized protein n=1 Tax=Araneus ventricosus TaxID=182803 RepID=A0A4Y2HZH0_ARAVE|nr:hypothetical protein AVEN_151479-1 [Araneus ventricosus]